MGVWTYPSNRLQHADYNILGTDPFARNSCVLVSTIAIGGRCAREPPCETQGAATGTVALPSPAANRHAFCFKVRCGAVGAFPRGHHASCYPDTARWGHRALPPKVL